MRYWMPGKFLIKGVAQLLHTIPVYGCSECSEVHVALEGHQIKDCLGPTSRDRHSLHSWVRGSIDDILVPIESYHLYDPFGRRIKHETRFEYDRIPAVVELCIQAGVDIPEYPSRRRMKPIRMIGKKVIDRGGFLEEPKPWRLGNPSTPVDFDTYRANERFPPPLSEDIPRIAQETMDAYDFVRSASMEGWKSMAGKMQFVDEVFPPNCVWHVRDPRGPPLRSALKRFYGKAPAVVEVCMQAGAQVPDRYKPMMRLDIIVPESDEAKLVA
ncbi:hypothetical protein NC653_035643 [Populus alba x Populus x berolinensis]|uniref:APO domain-containing protein n=1 Tax=Populus alba x Populus x berolinensis TaxID=444605 RepID=A0AAD6LI39_9ROSI|nr:hypothetical protein NC653_035643 [Populus alba x Populus x berolinensis]